MYDLGFLTNFINVIAHLYTNATTKVELPTGTTEPVHINRSTIQGDSLSPFLFLVFMEPLLRWLHSGGREYKHGCLQKGVHAEHATSDLDYADAQQIVSSNPAWLNLQAQKVEAFSNWAGMKVNCKKCGVTGMLYNYAQNGMVSNVLGKDAKRMLQAQLSGITIHDESVPFYHPHNQPYTYLEVDITPTLNWSLQLDKVIPQVKSKGDKVTHCMLTHMQKLLFVQTVIIPSATDVFPLAYPTPTDLTNLSASICK
jgi:hypothetical protein